MPASALLFLLAFAVLGVAFVYCALKALQSIMEPDGHDSTDCDLEVGHSMEVANARIELRNPKRPELGTVKIEALADTGAMHVRIPAHVRTQLELDAVAEKEATLADGSRQLVPYVGPIELRYLNRVGFTGALVTGDQPLLGAMALEDMDLVVVPKTQQVIINPDSPDIASTVAKANAAQAS